MSEIDRVQPTLGETIRENRSHCTCAKKHTIHVKCENVFLDTIDLGVSIATITHHGVNRLRARHRHPPLNERPLTAAHEHHFLIAPDVLHTIVEFRDVDRWS